MPWYAFIVGDESEGKVLQGGEALALNWNYTYAVAVSGSKWNPCGHMMLNVGGEHSGTYFQVGSMFGKPRYLDPPGFRRYLKENDQKELWRVRVQIARPNRASQRLMQLMFEHWFWAVLPHNCVAFVESIVQAGGSSFGMYSNCPRP
jgi:hypothetical protein